ncbi:Choline-sulfatase [Planctomycetes bacterium CA13]|uniref:Choline-sulfatase n=1 Tax=Novipirellula herctigrandis TaxID=2527986 RepID=A0A5C5ZB92_9BACT|nr:Choline-sulfatase [Planctomycetes bacterium CA13]
MKNQLATRWIAVVVTGLMCGALNAANDRPNVLLICSDDMRPQLHCYGDPTVQSPNIDRLAARGTLFNRSYVQQALCSPSRISMLSGRYPTTTQILNIGPTLRSTMPDITTVPQYFKTHGYDCRSFGKVYHVGIDDDASWSVPAWHSKKPRYGAAGQRALVARRKEYAQKGITPPPKGKGAIFYAGPAFEATKLGDDELLDGDTTVHGIEQLREYAKIPEQPFFLAVGFSNPHVPWVAPKKYFDMYDCGSLSLAKNEFLPKGAPPFAATSGADFLWYGNVQSGPLTETFKRECLQGYLAAISYVDAQVGRLLDALDNTGLAENTIVVFWTDHGYYMGEHTWWGAKHNNYEGATRNAMIIALPNQEASGQMTDALVQSVDIGPTLVDLCGLPTNANFEGRSLKPLIEDPMESVNDAAFSWYPKRGYLGVAMRSDRWRFVRWTKKGKPTQYELYDQQNDPQNDVNVFGEKQHAAEVEKLKEQLENRFPIEEGR